MSENITHLIFDWDGTLMDSAAKIVNCMQQAAKLAKVPVPSVESVEHIIGISLMPAIKQLFAVNDAKAEEIKEYYKSVFLLEDKTPCELFCGAADVISELSKYYTLGVATGKARRGLQRAFDSSGTEKYFSHSVCADEAESKPSPQMLFALLEYWNVSASEAIMIGDTAYDMKMAQACGMKSIAVSYGVHSRDLLEPYQPMAIIDDIRQLKSVVLRLSSLR